MSSTPLTTSLILTVTGPNREEGPLAFWDDPKDAGFCPETQDLWCKILNITYVRPAGVGSTAIGFENDLKRHTRDWTPEYPTPEKLLQSQQLVKDFQRCEWVSNMSVIIKELDTGSLVDTEVFAVVHFKATLKSS
jgi:hypothetical protein